MAIATKFSSESQYEYTPRRIHYNIRHVDFMGQGTHKIAAPGQEIRHEIGQRVPMLVDWPRNHT